MELPLLVRGRDGSYLLRLAMDGGMGTLCLALSDVEHFNSKELVAVLRAEVFPQVGQSVRYTGRINLLSASAKDDFLRSLKRLLRNDEVPIEQAFIQSIETFRESLEGEDESQWVEEVKAEQAKMLFNPFLVEGAPSVLFGKGGGAKTYLALRLALSLANGQPFMGFVPAKTVKTLFVDYEDTVETFAARRGHLFKAEPILTSMETDKTIRYWRARGTPLPDLMPRLRKIIQQRDIGLIIVDSAVSACGGEPEKADVVARYFNALASLGVTSLTIAHETKSENHAYPFGSVFWYNFPRSIWNARSTRDDEEGQIASRIIETGLFHRKANNGPLYQPLPLKITFDSVGDVLEAVKIERGDDSAWEDEKGIPARIRKALKERDMTRAELLEEMPSAKKDALDEELRRMKKRGEIGLRGTKGTPYFLLGLAKKNEPLIGIPQ